MERALKETELNVCSGRRSHPTGDRSDRAEFSLSRRCRRTAAIRSQASGATSGKFSKKKNSFRVEFRPLVKKNAKYLKRKLFPPVFKAVCIRMIAFYQKRLSRHTCLYEPTCSEYTKRCINNFGAVIGILLGMWRILRCNPLSKGGIDPAPENPFKKKWLL